jgi:phosphoesterase RecJ-like protein
LKQKYHSSILQLKEELSIPRKIVITTHQGPDGDAMGSSLALFHFLKKQSHDVSVITPNDYPDFLHWLPANNEVINYMRQKKTAETLIKNATHIFHLDYNHIQRSADMVRSLTKSKATRILIDHHLAPGLPAKYIFSEIDVSSTCELLYFIMMQWDPEAIDKDIATCIYTGIMTDTGSFCFRSASAQTFIVASELMNKEINRSKIYENVYDNYSESRMRLMGYCLNNKMEVFPEYHTALISLNMQEQLDYNFQVGDSEGFVNLPLSVEGVRFTAFFLEKEDKIKISFRSKGNFSTNDFSRAHFNGGGHINAAGGEIKMSLEETIRKFRDLLPLYKKQLDEE